MATYVVGDVHGCMASLEGLLARLELDWQSDHLWMVGDLVNRGPRSLAVLRWARERSQEMGERFVAVLGNHDLHLLARRAGVARAKPGDTLEELLAAPDAGPLVDWLAARPLLHRGSEAALIHAGLLPTWSLAEAERQARAAEAALRSETGVELLARRHPHDSALERALGAFTRLRTCTASGVPCRYSGPPESAPEGCRPWFEHPAPGRQSATLLFGHWATLGLHLGEREIGLDSGCVWGGALSAIRLQDRRVYRQPALEPAEERPRLGT